MVPATNPDPFAPKPISLGRYEVLGALARGGMATVYLGRHTGEAGFKRLYAIKVMHEHLADDNSFIEMLLDEARIAARLHHPNVVPIVDLGSQGATHYVAMEYVEGASLSALLAKYRDSRPPRMILPLMLDALAGLHAAHSLTDDDGNAMQLVHRDVSPQNVIVGVDGTARIIDFGIAKASSKVNSTRPGQMKGKLAFMAPEQLRDAQSVDARTDIWAAGAMLWSALTGRKLFLGASDAETLQNILSMEIPKPSTVGFQPPAELDDVILRALERDPEKRWQTAADMEEALRAVAERMQLLGSRREITAWLNAAFGEELAERRAILRGSDGSMPSASQASGFRMIPALGMNTSMTPSSRGATPARRNDEIPVETEVMPSRAPRFVVPALVAAVLVLGGVIVAMRKSEPAAVAAPVAAATATASATATAATPAPATASATATATATSTATATATATPSAVSAPTPKPAFSAAPVRSAAKPAPTPAATEPKKKAWDSDSPLPPQ